MIRFRISLSQDRFHKFIIKQNIEVKDSNPRIRYARCTEHSESGNILRTFISLFLWTRKNISFVT